LLKIVKFKASIQMDDKSKKFLAKAIKQVKFKHSRSINVQNLVLERKYTNHNTGIIYLVKRLKWIGCTYKTRAVFQQIALIFKYSKITLI